MASRGRASRSASRGADESESGEASKAAPQGHDALTKQMSEIADLRDELARVKESHVRREARMQHELGELKVQLQEATGGRDVPEKMDMIRATHGDIQKKLGEHKDRTVELLKQQKDEMARQFHLKLAEVVDAKSKSNEQEHSAEEWAARFREAQDHLKRTETHLIDSDRRNKLLETENKRLRSQYRSQENDREFLVRQLVAVKRDNVRLREELQKSNARGGGAGGDRPDIASGLPSRPGTADSYRSVGSHVSHASSAGRPASAASAGTSDTKLRETASRLKKLLDRERAQLRQVRAAFATDQQNRTELEGFLAQCVQDVRQEIGRRRQGELASRHGRPSSAASVGGAAGGRQPGYSDFDESDRSKVMEMLLSQERVIKLLYEKTFSRPAPRGAGDISRKSLNTSELPSRAQSAEPRAAAAAAAGDNSLIYSSGASSRTGASANPRLGRPSSAPHRQDDLRPPAWPGNDVSGP